MSDRPLAETLAEQSARVSLASVNGLRPAAPARPLSPNENVVVEGSGSARGLRPGQAELSLRKRCEITDRDIKIFSFLELYGVATLGQLWGIYFGPRLWEEKISYVFLDQVPLPKGTFTRAYKRLKKLADYGYLERGRWASHMIFKLSAKGHWQLVKRGVNRLGKHWEKGPGEHEMGHSLLLTASAALLSRGLGFTLKSEREIRRDIWMERAGKQYHSKENIPDLYIHSRARSLGLELELSLKSNQRYVEYWGNLGNGVYASAEPCLLYLTGSAAIQKHLLKLTRKESTSGIYFCELEHLKEDRGKAVFKNYAGFYFETVNLNSSDLDVQEGNWPEDDSE